MQPPQSLTDAYTPRVRAAQDDRLRETLRARLFLMFEKEPETIFPVPTIINRVESALADKQIHDLSIDVLIVLHDMRVDGDIHFNRDSEPLGYRFVARGKTNGT